MPQFRRSILTLATLLAFAHPVFAGKLAIVIDDFGYRPHTENQVLALPPNISVAVLPNAPHAREMATKAHNSGHEVLIHLPMAAAKQTAAGEGYAATRYEAAMRSSALSARR
ncbi:Putative periplasmic protein YibQ -like protein with nucleoside di phosphatase and polysaccharide deacetylase [Salmonella enterica subsp. enterica]|uniref:Periplasmic protein YibQ -like protein with nucleoside di phosphatase and polysaccharide deacetylase n=1 Tax=Salmonella enterica I TaxID=59201 RepID=A0A447TSI6_SALET|nr:Putative periplasmic protein YibQ -like protein with nucleoside di phosphatase and polysaccharide deacetylase [Salmonella enterica subsp. enterica]